MVAHHHCSLYELPLFATDTSSPLLQAPCPVLAAPKTWAEPDHLSWRRINSSWMASYNGNVNHYSEKMGLKRLQNIRINIKLMWAA